MTPPKHHKELAKFLHVKLGGDAKITIFRDNDDGHPIPVGEFGSGKKRLYSTIGAFELNLRLPEGNFEFAACSEFSWLPNVLASSIYWMDKRSFDAWPLICEDVVKHNTRSIYRHIAYVPSVYALTVSTKQKIQWLLGVPISDKEIGLSFEEVWAKARSVYPEWLFQVST